MLYLVKILSPNASKEFFLRTSSYKDSLKPYVNQFDTTDTSIKFLNFLLDNWIDNYGDLIDNLGTIDFYLNELVYTIKSDL